MTALFANWRAFPLALSTGYGRCNLAKETHNSALCLSHLSSCFSFLRALGLLELARHSKRPIHGRSAFIHAAVLRLGNLAARVQVLPPGHHPKVANSVVHLRVAEVGNIVLVNAQPLLFPGCGPGEVPRVVETSSN